MIISNSSLFHHSSVPFSCPFFKQRNLELSLLVFTWFFHTNFFAVGKGRDDCDFHSRGKNLYIYFLVITIKSWVFNAWDRKNKYLFLAWPIKNVSSLINTTAVDLFLIIYITHYHVVSYKNVFALLHFNRLKYFLALNAPVIHVSIRQRSFYLIPEDVCCLSFLPIGKYLGFMWLI